MQKRRVAAQSVQRAPGKAFDSGGQNLYLVDDVALGEYEEVVEEVEGIAGTRIAPYNR